MFVTAAYAQSAPTAATQTETGVAHGGEKPNFPPFDTALFPSQLLWLAISFVLFYLFMQKAVVPRISGVLNARRDRIEGDLGEARRLKDEVDAAIAAYQQEVAEARSKAESIGQAARDKAREEADAERAEVEKELAARAAAADKDIAAIKEQALGEIDTVASETAEAIVKQLIGASVTKTELKAAIAAGE